MKTVMGCRVCHLFLWIMLTVFTSGFALKEDLRPRRGDHDETHGELFFKGRLNQHHFREATLLVPSRGQGDIYLELDSHDRAYRAVKFFSKKRAGRTVFFVVFQGARPSSYFVFKGTYTRGRKHVLYYGDIFRGKDRTLDELENMEGDEFSLRGHKLRYVGGFYFHKERDHRP